MQSDHVLTLPLSGVLILELGQIIAGTYGAQILSDLGADVIKIEGPDGDLGRNVSIAPYNGVSGLFLTFNRNKKSIVIDLKTDAGRELFYEFVKIADVVVDNFRPGVLERLRIDYETLKKLNPKIIQCSITGFGSEGVYKDYPALDIIIQAISGHMAVTGEPGRPPVRVGVPLADLGGGLFSCKGILAALFDRERTQCGRRVEIAMFDVMIALLSYIATMYLSNGEVPQRPGSAHEYSVPWQAFAASDGYFVLATREDRFWRSLCGVIGMRDMADDPRFSTGTARRENKSEVLGRLQEVFRKQTVAHWITLLREAEVPAAPVNGLDAALAEPPILERGMIVEYDHPVAGRVRLPGSPIKIWGAPATPSTPAPGQGEHTDLVLRSLLKLSEAQITDLRCRKVVA